MGFLQHLSSVTAPARLRAETASQAHANAFWSGDPLPAYWMAGLTAAGIQVSPELAMTLSGFASGVRIIAYDLATVPCHIFQMREDGGKDRVRPLFGRGIDSSGGIRSLAYMLRNQPNFAQTMPEFMLGLVAQFLLRGTAYAEIVSGPTGFVEQLLPRHPDRIRVERLPSGRRRYKLIEANGQPRYVTAEEMFVVSDLSLDGGITSLSRVAYGANSIASSLATQQAAGKFWKSGMTAAKIATYEGEQDPEFEANLHASISRFAAGVENSFGFALVPDKVTIANLGVDPDKAQMMASQEWGIKEAARLLNLNPRKLGIETTTTTGASLEEENAQHATNCLRPIAVLFEEAIRRDLILVKDSYFAEFILEALMRGNAASRAAYYKAAIEAPWMWPSEVRIKENMNPDEDLDKLAEVRYRPGTPRNSPDGQTQPPPSNARATLRGMLAIHDHALRCVHRERVAVMKLAQQHAADPTKWAEGLTAFYADHAQFVSELMRVPIGRARDYCGAHGTNFLEHGVKALDERDGELWERDEGQELTALALEGHVV